MDAALQAYPARRQSGRASWQNPFFAVIASYLYRRCQYCSRAMNRMCCCCHPPCHPEQREGSAFTAVKKQILRVAQDEMLTVTIPVGFMERSEATKQSRL